MKKIAVCIPTYNEADMIESTASKIDKGLSKYSLEYDTYIVNCDNNSKDGTGNKFKKMNLDTKKVYICSKEIGKGINIINFLNFCKDESIDYAITLDADVKSMNEKWIELFLNALINEKQNYVVPSYERIRFEGSTTNQFAFPLLYALTGKKIRQPIGGDFAFDKKYIDYIIKNPINNSIKKYGIDIFMTLNAAYGGFNVRSLELGKKIHKPSFDKMYSMFAEVLDSAIYTVSNQKNIVLKTEQNEEVEEKTNLLCSRKFVHKENANKLLDYSYNCLNKKDRKYLKELGYNGCKVIDDEEWENILYILIQKLSQRKNFNNDELKDFVDIFIIRAVSYWNRAEKISAIEAENIILNLAKDLRKKVIKTGENYVKD